MRRQSATAVPPRSEGDEREFWWRRDSARYVDYVHAQRARLTALQPTTRAVTLRLPQALLENLRVLANREDVPYQSLMKIYLAEKVADALRVRRRAPARH